MPFSSCQHTLQREEESKLRLQEDADVDRNTYLYASSRNVFMLAQNYAPLKIARVLGRTNDGNTPLASILFCSALGFLSLIGLTDKIGNQVREFFAKGVYITEFLLMPSLPTATNHVV